MKYVDEFRDGARAPLAAAIAAPAIRPQATTSWNSAAATPTRSPATASRICCRRTCA